MGQLIQSRDKYVREVFGLNSTAKSLVVKDEAALHLMSMVQLLQLGFLYNDAHALEDINNERVDKKLFIISR